MTQEELGALTLEERVIKANEEIRPILLKYQLGYAVDISGAQDFINSLKPVMVEGKPTEEAETVGNPNVVTDELIEKNA